MLSWRWKKQSLSWTATARKAATPEDWSLALTDALEDETSGVGSTAAVMVGVTSEVAIGLEAMTEETDAVDIEEATVMEVSLMISFVNWSWNLSSLPFFCATKTRGLVEVFGTIW